MLTRYFSHSENYLWVIFHAIHKLQKGGKVFVDLLTKNRVASKISPLILNLFELLCDVL